MVSLLTFTKKNKENIIFILIFLILPWIFFNDSIKINSVIFGNGDPNNFTLPLWDLVIKSVKSGEFPFWNRYIYSGFPLFANIQANTLYPFIIPFGLIFPIHIAYDLIVLIHYSLAGIFTFLFLSQYKLEKFACFAGGLIFMFSGIMICHKGHVQMLLTVIWLPLILFFLNKFKELKRYENILIAAIFLSISFFGGNPQLFLYESLVILLFILYYSVINLKKHYFFLLSLTIFLISFLIILFQLIPVNELSGLSLRNYLEYGAFTEFSFPRKMIPTLLFPFIYGSGPSGVSFFGSISFIETAAYFGITTIPFLIFGFFSKNKDKYLWFFILVLSFLLVLGINTPLYKLMFHLPLYNKFRIPTRNWFEFGFAFSVISAFGFDYYIKSFTKRSKKIITGVIAFFSALLLISLFIKQIIAKIGTTLFINKLAFIRENLSSLLVTTSLGNISFLIPVILLAALLVILIVSMFRKNKYIYILLILIFFIDLRFFGNYAEGTSDSSYLYKDIKKIEEYSFINEEKELFRVYPVVRAEFGGVSIYPNRNIHYEVESYGGYDALIYNLYNWYTGIALMDNKDVAQRVLKNNNILSILNTKYITYYEVENIKNFMDDISKVYYGKNEKILVSSELNDLNKKLKNAEVDSGGNIILGGNENELKYFEVPVSIKSDKDYLVTFKIREDYDSVQNSEDLRIDNKIFLDFYGPDYDEPEHEFVIEPSYISKDSYKTVEKVIYSGKIPSSNSEANNVNFRIFTYSKGYIEIQDLEINEVDVFRFDNYNLIADIGIIILENKNACPRFYFASEVKEVKDFDEEANILNESGSTWISGRFNPKEQVIIENPDFKNREFDNKTANLEILNYSNNEVLLNTISSSEQFLVFSDTYYPGWKAFIDGIETKIYRTNGLVKGIYIPEDSHIIKFSYKPDNFWIYFSVSLFTLISVIITIIALLILKFKKEKNTLNRKY